MLTLHNNNNSFQFLPRLLEAAAQPAAPAGLLAAAARQAGPALQVLTALTGAPGGRLATKFVTFTFISGY